jgi:hypothetical protein
MHQQEGITINITKTVGRALARWQGRKQRQVGSGAQCSKAAQQQGSRQAAHCKNNSSSSKGSNP